jgi:hypothetical protein
MTGIEVVVGCLIAWAAKKARRVGARADAEADHVLDAGMDKVHELVAAKLGADPALAKLQAEVEHKGTVTTRTRDRVRLAVEEAGEQDPDFAAQIEALVARIEQVSARAVAGDHSTAVAGDVVIQATDGSVSAWRIGDVTFGGGHPVDPPQPGQRHR